MSIEWAMSTETNLLQMHCKQFYTIFSIFILDISSLSSAYSFIIVYYQLATCFNSL